MTTACRLVPTLRMAALRVAASGSPPSPPRPQGRHRPAPHRRGRAEPPWSRQVPPWPYRVQGSAGLQGSDVCIFTCPAHFVHSGLNYSYEYLAKRVTNHVLLSPDRHPKLASISLPPYSEDRQSKVSSDFLFLVKHSFIKRTSAVYELPFVQITSVIQRYKTQAMHNSRLGGRRGTLPLGLRI